MLKNLPLVFLSLSLFSLSPLSMLFLRRVRRHQKRLGQLMSTASSSPTGTQTIRVPIAELEIAIETAFKKCGHEDAKEIAVLRDVLMYAELRKNNQGIVKLIANALNKNKACHFNECTIVSQTGVSAKLDGQQRIGMLCVSDAVDMAIEKAKKSGVGLVSVSNYSSATGALGYWARRIARERLVGIVLSQCPEYVAPYGSYQPLFGTNPLAIGLPTKPVLTLDMATSAMAYYGLVTAQQEGQSIPPDVAWDAKGKSTQNPAEALRGALRVFDRSHKGSGLSLMIELLAGALTGASMENKGEAKNWGSLIICFDPNLFGSLQEFEDSSKIMMERVKNAPLLPNGEEGKSIFLPGERGDACEAECLRRGSIELPLVLYEKLRQV